MSRGYQRRTERARRELEANPSQASMVAQAAAKDMSAQIQAHIQAEVLKRWDWMAQKLVFVAGVEWFLEFMRWAQGWPSAYFGDSPVFTATYAVEAPSPESLSAQIEALISQRRAEAIRMIDTCMEHRPGALIEKCTTCGEFREHGHTCHEGR